MTTVRTTEHVPTTRQGLGLMWLREGTDGDADRDPARLVRTAVDHGVTLLDTAEMYGNEELVGRAIAGIRDEIELCTKFGVYFGASGRFDDWSVRADAATVHAAVDGSLRRLGVETIDLYYLHHRSETTPIEETVAAMAELLHAGKIRAIGLSNVTVQDIRRAHAVHPVWAVQQAWSLANREVEDMLPVLDELGIELVAHSPIDHGSLVADGTVAGISSRLRVPPGRLALAWVHEAARRGGHAVVPIPGTTRIPHLLDNIAARALRLTDDEFAALTDGPGHARNDG